MPLICYDLRQPPPVYRPTGFFYSFTGDSIVTHKQADEIKRIIEDKAVEWRRLGCGRPVAERDECEAMAEHILTLVELIGEEIS